MVFYSSPITERNPQRRAGALTQGQGLGQGQQRQGRGGKEEEEGWKWAVVG